jgi:hypothetical protein
MEIIICDVKNIFNDINEREIVEKITIVNQFGAAV